MSQRKKTSFVFTRHGPARTLAMVWRKGAAMEVPLKAVAATVRRQFGGT